MSPDLLIAGAGPAGLSAAIRARHHGLSVLVLDPQEGTIDKACGEGLMPSGVGALRTLGIDDLPHQPFLGIRYWSGDRSAEATFPTPGWGIRRLALHAALRRRADEVGVRFTTERVTALAAHADHVTVNDHRAAWVIGADGLRSPVRHLAGLDRPAYGRPRYGLRQHVRLPPWTDHVEVHWAPDAEAYVTPVDHDLVGIAFLFGDAARTADQGQPGSPFDRLLARFPRLQRQIADAEPASHPRGAGPFRQASSARVAGRVLLIGDAAGYVDPLTGEGVKLALHGGIGAVDALAAGRPTAWEAAWRREWQAYARPAEALLAIAQSPLRPLIVPTLRVLPPLMPAILRHLAR